MMPVIFLTHALQETQAVMERRYHSVEGDPAFHLALYFIYIPVLTVATHQGIHCLLA